MYDPHNEKVTHLWGTPEPQSVPTHSQCSSGMRLHHTCALAPHQLLIFHGKHRFLVPPALFDLKQRILSDLPATGDLPSRRIGASAVYVPNKDVVYLYGGLDSDGMSSNELFAFSVERKEWRKLGKAVVGGEDFGVLFHCAEVVGQRMYVFGGVNEKGKSNKVIVFSFEEDQNTWKEVATQKYTPKYRIFFRFFIDFLSHYSRFFRAGVYHSFVFGEGRSCIGYIDSEKLDTVHVFDAEREEWCKKRKVGGRVPAGRKYGTLTYSPDHKSAFLIGGIDSNQKVVDQVDTRKKNFIIFLSFILTFTNYAENISGVEVLEERRDKSHGRSLVRH